MRPFAFVRIIVAACVALTAAGLASACQCAPMHVYGNTRWEQAKKEESESAVIFEGTSERSDLEWDLLSARVGELIPALANTDDTPRMLVTFRVTRLYRGALVSKSRSRQD